MLKEGKPQEASMGQKGKVSSMRHGKVKKRDLTPDPIYKNKLVTKLINKIMRSGKKSVAQNQVYEAFEIIRQKNEDPLEVFNKAVQNVSPRMEVRSRRVGGAAYQVPMEVRPERKIVLALHWIIDASRKRPNKEYHTFAQKFAVELLDAAQGQGGAIKKRDIMHRMAEANRAFAHFRW